MSSLHVPERSPSLEDPDYVALLIEWDDDDNAAAHVNTRAPSRTPPVNRKIATVVGALSAIGTWGLRRLGGAS